VDEQFLSDCVIKKKLIMLLLGFACVCTAGILLPLHFTIGIRLSKEDEIKGLDVTGKIFDLFMKIKK